MYGFHKECSGLVHPAASLFACSEGEFLHLARIWGTDWGKCVGTVHLSRKLGEKLSLPSYRLKISLESIKNLEVGHI